ncbi:DUF4365 domain-containing protein [Paenibacillus athensensis]|nr:DUF4365 domain-containing protein [Paenibacillus athensensis]MCD1261010.1 DUF4365 domain-containing protein [Paenibacillus athensensis]
MDHRSEGNLPESPETHNQERRSKAMFDIIVPDHLFLVRNEDGGDYGVDKVIELKLQGTRMSNFRSHIQLKCTSSRLNNSYLPFSVPIKTLNYLRNQPSSMFVIFLEHEKIFLWEWISEIVNFSASKEIDITTTDQKTVNFHFIKKLDDLAFEEIHNDIRIKCSIATQISDNLKLSKSTATNILVNVQEQKVMSSDTLVEYVKRYGYPLANEGKFAFLNEWISQIPLQFKSDPEYSLTVAYIKYNNGEYYDAYSWLPKGITKLKLDETEKELAEYLDISLKYLLNMCSVEMYNELFNSFQKKYPHNQITLQHRLFRLREELITADMTLKDSYRELTDSFQALMRTVKQIHTPESMLVKFVDLVEWEIIGFQILRELQFSKFNLEGRETIGYPIPQQKRIHAAQLIIQKIEKWMLNFRSIFISIEDEVSRARASTIFASIQLQFIAQTRMYKDLTTETNSLLHSMKESLEHGAVVLEQGGYLHELFRAQMSLAECYMGLGLVEQATELVQQVMLNAEGIGVLEIVTYCKLFLDGYYVFNYASMAQAESKSKRKLSVLSDAEIEKYARQMIELLEIPNDRFPNVLNEYRWLQQDEIDRFQFCEHIGTRQDLSVNKELQNKFLVNPDRIIICEKFGHQSLIGQSRDELARLFKSNFCRQCNAREPIS